MQLPSPDEGLVFNEQPFAGSKSEKAIYVIQSMKPPTCVFIPHRIHLLKNYFRHEIDQMKIRIIQPQVELELGLNFAKIQHSLRDTFFGTPFIK